MAKDRNEQTLNEGDEVLVRFRVKSILRDAQGEVPDTHANVQLQPVQPEGIESPLPAGLITLNGRLCERVES